MIACVHACVYAPAVHTWRSGETLWGRAILSSFTKVPGIELRSPGLCSKHYLLSSLANPLRQSCLFVLVTGFLYLALAVLELTI